MPLKVKAKPTTKPSTVSRIVGTPTRDMVSLTTKPSVEQTRYDKFGKASNDRRPNTDYQQRHYHFWKDAAMDSYEIGKFRMSI